MKPQLFWQIYFAKNMGLLRCLKSEIIVGVQLQSTNLDTRSTSVKVREAQSGKFKGRQYSIKTAGICLGKV